MTISRSQIRSRAKAALAANPRMSGFEQISAWTGNIEASRLPVLGAVTPGERIDPETWSHYQRATVLQVVAKRLGRDDLEDQLDADADAIEAATLQSFAQWGVDCVPVSVSFTLNGEGEQRIGTVVAEFRVTWHRDLSGQTL